MAPTPASPVGGRPRRSYLPSRPGDAGLEPWRAFVHAHALVTRRLDDDLQRAHGISLAEYEALLWIARAPDRRVRMSVLAGQVLLSRSGVTRLIDRLVADGSVERRACPTDLRGAEATLTEAGLARLRAASATHVGGVNRYFIERMDAAERATVERALDRIVGDLEGDGGTPAEPDADPRHEGRA